MRLKKPKIQAENEAHCNNSPSDSLFTVLGSNPLPEVTTAKTMTMIVPDPNDFVPNGLP